VCVCDKPAPLAHRIFLSLLIVIIYGGVYNM